MQTQPQERYVRLFRNGSNQAIRIPREFEFEGKMAVIRKVGCQLIIEAVKKKTLIEFLDSLAPLNEDFPDIDNDLLPLDDIVL